MRKIRGIGASAGVFVAPAYVLEEIDLSAPAEPAKNPDAELERLAKSVDATVKEIENIKIVALDRLGSGKAEIFDAHSQIVQDPEILEAIKLAIKVKKENVVKAVQDVYGEQEKVMKAMDDPYFKERAADLADVAKRLVADLLGKKLPDVTKIDKEVIVVAHDLSPSVTVMLDPKFVKGFVTDIGGRTSHAAIMARSMGIPAVLGLKDVTKRVKADETVAMDGDSGEVVINPDEATVAEYREFAAKFAKRQAELAKYVKGESVTTDGHKVVLEANIGSPSDVKAALANGAEGIGLFRTEFLYMEASEWPGEEQQYKAYAEVLAAMGEKQVVIRTIDIGGDKTLPYFSFPEEMNPFLGYRAIRLSLDRKDVFKTQLRALVRSSAHGSLSIMFPMIATVGEFEQAKALYDEALAEVKKEGHMVGKIEVGIMVEVPASAVLADVFAKKAEFFSIGTNDLIQYSMAADRMSEQVAYLYQPLNPSLLRLIKSTIEGGHGSKRWVGMCGEMAGDPKAVPVLLGLGLDAFSMSASSVPAARRIVSSVSLKDAKQLAEQALKCENEEQVAALVEKFLKARDL